MADKFIHEKSKVCLYLNDAKMPLFQSPSDYFSKPSGYFDVADLSTPYAHDESGNPHFIVNKNGQSIDFPSVPSPS